MKQNRCSTPLGTKDLLFEESFIRRKIEKILSSLFARRGFSEVMTPGMEFLDVFLGDNPSLPIETMYKLTDTKGRLLVMRPDSTQPIARLTATRLQNMPKPLRLYYAQDVYHMNVGLTGRADQEFQAGIEMIGAPGIWADLEVVTLACAALRSVVGERFRLEIGHVGYFESLMKELEANAQIEEEIRTLIEGKNYAALSELLDTLPQTDAVRALAKLPHLFGGKKVLDKARSLCCSPQGNEALTYLEHLYESLCSMGLEKHVIFDLGMLHCNEYYTGVIFRGYIENSGEIALSGGRYDALLEQYGSSQAATGFAINVDVLMRVLANVDDFSAQQSCEMLVHPLEGYEIRALTLTDTMSKQGRFCEFSVFRSVEEARCYALQKGISKLMIVGETETTEVIGL